MKRRSPSSHTMATRAAKVARINTLRSELPISRDAHSLVMQFLPHTEAARYAATTTSAIRRQMHGAVDMGDNMIIWPCANPTLRVRHALVNEPTPQLPASVTTVAMDDMFVKPGFVLPPSVTTFTMGFWFNQPDFVLPPSVTSFTMGDYFNQPGFVLPSSVTTFIRGCGFNQPDFVLPPSVTTFGACLCFDPPGFVLPATVRVFNGRPIAAVEQ